MLKELAPDLFIQRHPLSMLGCKMGRVVTVIRLRSGKLIVHSTADFSADEAGEIRALGEVGWLVEATRMHDTFSKAGRKAFQDVPYLVPPQFEDADELGATSFGAEPEDWGDEVRVIEIGGIPKLREHALYHAPSKTLIVADLVFNLPPSVGGWTQMFLRAMAGIKKYPGMSRLLRLLIKDRAAFVASIGELAELGFERIVVAHGDPIEVDAKAKFLELMAKHQLAP